jgi:polyisoprenyl-phosphate glycosyltransferase
LDSNTEIVMSLVVPVYNEIDNILEFVNQVLPVVESCTSSYELIFSVDPSTDGTESCINDLRAQNPRIKMITFSRRFGQPAATLAGLEYCRGKCAVVMDVDLQDPPELIPEMYEKWKSGFDVVYATRTQRDGEKLIKLLITKLGYSIIGRFGVVSIPRNTGDFRLMDRRVLSELSKFQETSAFLRGLVALIGFKQTEVLFSRPKRFGGKGKYNLWIGSLKIGFNGIVGFSTALLNLSTIFGFIFAGTSFVFGCTYLGLQIAGANFPVGNPTLVFLVLFTGGVQLISIGIIGQYIGRIYDEVKRRPRYIVDKLAGLSEREQ